MPTSPKSAWSLRFIRNILLWLLPALGLWLLLTPYYNVFVLTASENLLHLTESPNATKFLRINNDDAEIQRLDFPPSRQRLHPGFRVSDFHFHFILLLALFLGVPDVPWRKRLENFAIAAIASAFFHILLGFFQAKFTYATQLGNWSLEHYGAFARNFYGLGKHLLDLPVKLAWPFALWAGFYLGMVLPKGTGKPAS